MPIDLTLLVAACAIAFIAGILKGSIGFGFPLISVPALAFLYGTRSAVVIVALPLAIANILLLARRPVDRIIIRRFLPLMLVLMPSTYLGGVALASLDARPLSVALGVVILAVVAISAASLHPTIPAHLERPAGLLVALVGGILGGATSIPGPLFALYVGGLGLDKRTFVYAITLLFVVVNTLQLLSYSQLGLFQAHLVQTSLAVVPAALLGQQVGFLVQDRLRPHIFRRVVLVVVGISGANILLRGLGFV